jgi:GTPase involved in cell partitioning and DNA repair
MKLCEELENQKEKLKKKQDYVIKNKVFVNWINEDLAIMKMYCDKEKCPTIQCKEIYRLQKHVYKCIGD